MNISKKIKVGVVGDLMLDIYHYGKVERISPEFPVPILHSMTNKSEIYPGGAANVGLQFKHLNAEVVVFGFIDEDFLKLDLDLSGCVSCNWQQPRKHRFYDDNFPMLRYDVEKIPEECNELSVARNGVLEKFTERIRKLDVVVFSNYSKGLFSSAMIKEMINQCNKFNVISVVDPKSDPISWSNCKILKPNYKEAVKMTNSIGWKTQCDALVGMTNCETVVITKSGDGVYGKTNGEYFCYEPKHKIGDINSVIGAGDAFAAYLAASVARGNGIKEATTFAFEAGSEYVRSKHNRPVCPYEVKRHLDRYGAKIINIHELKELRHVIYKDKKWVQTGGCFDILHSGHLKLLGYSKDQGDKLVVVLNSDDSIKRLKGNNRPINSFADRAMVLSYLECVDFIVEFTEDSPENLTREILPDALIKGSDYKNKLMPEAKYAKEVLYCDLMEGKSTTNIISKVKSK